MHFASASMTIRPAFADDPAQDGEAAKIDSKSTRKTEQARLLDVESLDTGASILSI
jgi:hypothetical protein